MGTNYYWHAEECLACRRTSERVHIGKSSAGWHFGLHVVETPIDYGWPDDVQPRDLEDWKKIWERPGSLIRNEYGDRLSPKEMLDIITQRFRSAPERTPGGYKCWGEFHKRNFSEFGLNNLIRRKVGITCFAHGDGTWDLISGEFS